MEKAFEHSVNPRRKERIARKHLFINEEIARKIRSGIYSMQMPSVNQLAEEFNANPLTIRKSLDTLEKAGLIEKRERIGSFVKKKQRIAMLYISAADCKDNLLQSPVYQPLSQAIESELEKSGYSLFLRKCSSSDIDFATALKKEVDGCVVIASNTEIGYLQNLKGIPLVRVMSLPGGETENIHISYDNSLIGPLAADYLSKKGCRVFAYFGHAAPILFKERLDSFKESVKASGGEAVQIHADAGMDEGGLFQAAKDGITSLLSKYSKEQIGIYISADLFAVSVYQAMYSLNLVPVQDMHVISNDNNPIYLQGLYPQPPTIDIRMAEIGRRASHTLVDIIAGKRQMETSNEKIIFPPIISSRKGAAQ